MGSSRSSEGRDHAPRGGPFSRSIEKRQPTPQCDPGRECIERDEPPGPLRRARTAFSAIVKRAASCGRSQLDNVHRRRSMLADDWRPRANATCEARTGRRHDLSGRDQLIERWASYLDNSPAADPQSRVQFSPEQLGHCPAFFAVADPHGLPFALQAGRTVQSVLAGVPAE